MSVYKCPVCNSSLSLVNKSYKCKNNHSYDLSKKGYVNLILANQGHSLNEGDSKEMIDSRRKFLQGEFYSSLKYSLSKTISSFIFNNSDPILFLDVACGEGYYTNFIHQQLSKVFNIETFGVDISKAAINASAGYRNLLNLNNISYCVGNMDYLPFLDGQFDILLNCFAPINEKEFHRVIKQNGIFIRVLPGKYHLYELKEFLYKEIHLNQPKEDKINGFLLENTIQVDDVISLDNTQIQNLFTMTPYYYKTPFEAKERLKKLESLDTKISFVLKVYRKI